MNDLTKIIVWVVVVGVVFTFLWRKGHLQQIATYVQQTREELKKCTWPTWTELKGSTVVVSISIVLLGVLTVAVDFVFNLVFFKFL